MTIDDSTRAAEAVRASDIRPLVVPTRFAPDESLIGAIASSTRSNVLRHLDVILDEIGLPLLRPDTVGQELGGLAPRLAEKLRCEVREIADRLHPYLVGVDPDGRGGGNWRLPVRWGSGVLLRQHLDLRTRRISPRALTLAPHHRSHWLCLLLPYCVETLDLLVNACDACGAQLAWRIGLGIGVCEHCRAVVKPSAEPPLPEPHAAGYRRFASLISPVTSEREAALSALEPTLRSLSPTSLIELVLGLGHALTATCRGGTDDSSPMTPAMALAVRIARGTDLLALWPNDLRDAISRSLDGDQVDPNSRRTLSRRIRRLGDPAAAAADQVALLRAALPEAFETVSRALALTGPVMLASDIARRAGISMSQVRELESAGVFAGVDTRKGERIHRQYPQADAQRVIDLWRGSEGCTRLEQRLSIPRYAVEQLALFGEVDPELSTIATLLGSNLRLVSRSVDLLVSDLDACLLRDVASDEAVPLAAVMRTMGGRLKPWGAVIASMRRGEVPFWPSPDFDDRASRGWRWVRRVLVRPADVEPSFVEPLDLRPPSGFRLAETVSQVDACEILNCSNLQMREVVDAGDLQFTAIHRGLRTPMPSVLELAARTIASPELARLLDMPTNPLVKMMAKRQAVRKASVGWVRADVEADLPNLLRIAAAQR